MARALAKNPFERFPSCAAFVRALPTFVADCSPSRPATHSGAAIDQTGQQDQTILTRRPLPPRHSGVTARRARQEPPPSHHDQYAHLKPVMPVNLLQGKPNITVPAPDLSAREYVEAVVRAAAEAATPMPEFGHAKEEGLSRRFLSTLPAGMIPLKIVIVAERWGFSAQQLDARRIVLWRDAVIDPHRPERDESRTRVEVMVLLPTPPSAEITAVGGLFGAPRADFAKNAREELPAILDEIRAQLQNQDERRMHPRFAAPFPVRVFPLYSDGDVGAPVVGRCMDVSAGGVRLKCEAPIKTERMFVEIQDVPATAGMAVYARLLRSAPAPTGGGAITVCRFRTSAG